MTKSTLTGSKWSTIDICQTLFPVLFLKEYDYPHTVNTFNIQMVSFIPKVSQLVIVQRDENSTKMETNRL